MQFTGYEQLDTKRLLHLYREGTEVNLRYFYPLPTPLLPSTEKRARRWSSGFWIFYKMIFLPFPAAFTLCWRRTAAG